MIDKVVGVGAGFDVITPLLTFAQNLAYGPGHTFLISRESGWSGRDVANLLHRKGVKTWGHMVAGGSLMLRVRQQQARWAQYILENAGIPLEGGAVAEGSAGKAGPTTQSQPRRSTGGVAEAGGSIQSARPSKQSRTRPSSGGIAEALRELGDLRLF